MVGRMTEPRVRPAILDDADAIAAVHHTAWVQTYSHLLPAGHWESDTVARRRERWRDQLSGEASGRPLVAVVDQDVVGFARAGATRGKDGVPPVRADELWALYVVAVHHGTGVGTVLLDAVLPSRRPAELWGVAVVRSEECQDERVTVREDPVYGPRGAQKLSRRDPMCDMPLQEHRDLIV
jgi:GNAT superfamily N-acetyltransferase